MLAAFAACALEMPPSALHEHRDYSRVADVYPCPSEGTYMCSRVFRICTECFHTGTPVDVLEGRDDHPFFTSLIRTHHFQLRTLEQVPVGYPLVHPTDTTVATYGLPPWTLR